MTAPVFVDTNVLVYAIDASAGDKHRIARRWMEVLWQQQTGRVSIQVLQELYATVTRKLRPGLSSADAQRETRAFLVWSPVETTPSIVERAWYLESRYQLSWWDALIVASAQHAGCHTLLTEDLQHGQDFDGVVVRSPFIAHPNLRGFLSGIDTDVPREDDRV
jgi:predicted nucleic acid-binding protein